MEGENESCEGENMKKADPLRMIRVELTAILVAEREPVSWQQIATRYEDEIGIPLDPKTYQFNTVPELLDALRDNIVAVTLQGHKLYRTKFSHELRDLQKLVQSQTTKEERLIEAQRKNRGRPVRVSQFSSRFQNTMVQSGWYNSATHESTRKPAANLVTQIYHIMKHQGILNNEGLLEMSLYQLKEAFEEKYHEYMFQENTTIINYVQLFRNPDYSQHWKIEERPKDGYTTYFMVLKNYLRVVQEGTPQKISVAGRRLALNSLKTALFHNREMTNDTSLKNSSLSSSDNLTSLNSVESTRIDSNNLKYATTDIEEIDNLSESLKIFTFPTPNGPGIYSREEFCSLRYSNYFSADIIDILKNHPSICRSHLRQNLAESTDPMTSRKLPYGIFNNGRDPHHITTNIICPIAKEESEVYKKIEKVSSNTVNTTRGRFVAPSQTEKAPLMLNGKGRAELTDWQTTKENRYLSRSCYDPPRYLDQADKMNRQPGIFSRLSFSQSEKTLSLGKESAIKALAAMNEIDDEFSNSESEFSDNNEDKESSVNLMTEYDLAWMKHAKFVEDPQLDEIRMCAPMYFVPPTSILISFESGNENGCARFAAVQRLLQAHFAKYPFEPLKAPKLGLPCIARSADANEFARVIIVSMKGSTIECACLDYHGFVIATPDSLSVLPTIFSPRYLPCNTFLARFNAIKCIPAEKYQDLAKNIAEQSPGSNEFMLFTTAIFGVDPADNKTVVDWITPSGCWKSTEILRLYNAVHKSNDPSHPTSDEVELASKEIELNVSEFKKIEWAFSADDKSLKREAELLEKWNEGLLSDSSAIRISSEAENEVNDEKLVHPEKNTDDIKQEEDHRNSQPKIDIVQHNKFSISPEPEKEERVLTPQKVLDQEYKNEILNLSNLLASVSDSLYPEIRSPFNSLVAGIAKLAKSSSMNENNEAWDSVIEKFMSRC